MTQTAKNKASRNRTLACSEQELGILAKELITLRQATDVPQLDGKIIRQDFFEAAPHLPSAFIDLLILDPPYNLSKNYHGNTFKEQEKDAYLDWFGKMLKALRHSLKPSATVYVCADWKTSLLIAPLLDTHFYIQNRITWEREKGRGAKTNWKNNSEDIWFCTMGKTYYFDVDAVKLKKKVIAPYRSSDGQPKDWEESDSGNFRLTHPSNLWTDISIPFWSMPENTAHPTQKPEKLIAKLILAGSREGDFVFDPFLGSGTTVVVAKKLRRRFSGIEHNREYCCWGQKRLNLATRETAIQGYTDGVFWERNTFRQQRNADLSPLKKP